VRKCVDYALRTYPFRDGEKSRVFLEGRDFEAFGSELLLSYVIYNLLRNSLDAIGEARKGEIRIVLEPGEDWHRLYFRDTGIGISSEVLPHVFEEFYSGKGEGRGTGMGLPFCRRVMNSFGGEVKCRSREGEYTELELTFPRVEVGQRESHRVGGDTT
ncbi:MAG: ATP-binding protein, partial [Chromatiaceae bacterium]|nr:ATP-binding protein [Chromatiaceae bacterium]